MTAIETLISVLQVSEAIRLAEHLEKFRSFPDDIAAATELRRQDAAIEALQACYDSDKKLIDELQKETLEQARLLGVSAEKELALRNEIEESKRELAKVKASYHSLWCKYQSLLVGSVNKQEE